jgi:uncharacterized coiled-coil DUF342 family protein
MEGDSMNEESLMMFLTGPFSGLALALVMLWGIGKMVAKYVPKIVDKHLNQIDEQIKANSKICDRLDQMREAVNEQHTQQTEAMRKAVSGLHSRLNPMENDIKEVKTFLQLSSNAAATARTEGGVSGI